VQLDRQGHKPLYPTWQDVPNYERNAIDALVNQWEQLVGFTVPVSDQIKADMASWEITSMYQMGQYMTTHTPDADMTAQALPWAQYGLTYDDMYSQFFSYSQTMMDLTGQPGDWGAFQKTLGDYKGHINFGALSDQYKQDPNLNKNYGWLRFGLDYNQFSVQKMQYEQTLGHTLSNDEAVTQLQYMHAGAGASQGVSQSPTLTQVEKRQAQTGIGQSVVR
jgi:hypothetical protein